MKSFSFFLFLLVSAGSGLFTSCTTTSDDTAPGGISASETGMNRESIYKWQDRTMRELAY
ncbi:MAG: hypothetical protein GXX91_01530 [Verrucomicrobiaceae bacterium]|nr:hypothetical protein [Verrucomicrobiaceae bacterium]